MISLALLAALVFAAPSADDEAGLGVAIEKLRAAEIAANEDPETGVAPLKAALDAFEDFGPVAAESPAAQEARILAQLTLARAYLALQDVTAAEEAIGEALRISRGEPLPVDLFGPSLTKLHEERLQALEAAGKGGLEVNCSIPCRVYLNERKAEPEIDGLPVGRYRLWVEPENPDEGPRWRTTVAVVTPGDTVTLEYPGRSAPSPETDTAKTPTPRRLMPRWAEVVTMSVGFGGVVAGAVLLGLDGRCAGEDKDPATCADLWEFTAAGWTTLSVGAAILISGATLLGVDEVRLKKNGKTTARFRPTAGGVEVRF